MWWWRAQQLLVEPGAAAGFVRTQQPHHGCRQSKDQHSENGKWCLVLWEEFGHALLQKGLRHHQGSVSYPRASSSLHSVTHPLAGPQPCQACSFLRAFFFLLWHLLFPLLRVFLDFFYKTGVLTTFRSLKFHLLVRLP